MIYRFEGNDLLKATGTFIPDSKNCIKADLFIQRIMGNRWLKTLDPLSNKDFKTISATEIDDFKMGGAIIRKGENFAIITNDGMEFIPWGIYKFNVKGGYQIDKEKCGYHNGFTVVRDPVTEKYGFINVLKKLIVPCTLLDAEPFEDDGFARVKETNKLGVLTDYFIDTLGKKFPIKKGILYSSLMLNESFYCVPVSGAFEFYHKTGRLVFKTKRRVMGPYSDGLIRVDTVFELAGSKSGFIDTLNRLIIPYRNESIGNFHYGLALVVPRSSDEYKFAFLNKNNRLQIQLKLSDEIKNIDRPTDFLPVKTYSKKEAAVSWLKVNNKLSNLDREGDLRYDIAQTHPDMDFSNLTYLKYGEAGKDQMYIPFEVTIPIDMPVEFTSGGVGGGRKMTRARRKSEIKVGQANLNGSVKIQPVFDEIGYHDPYSGLIKAKFFDNQKKILVEGYINEEGIFAIIKSN